MTGRPVQSILLALSIASQAAAQSETDDSSRFRPLEAGIEDVSPNAVAPRMQAVDLRTPVGFDRVYAITDAPGLLARRSGSVTAVFSRSIYGGDASPQVPPGTVFYIGKLPVNLAGPGLLSPFAHVSEVSPMSRLLREETSINTYRETRVDAVQTEEPESGPTHEPLLFESERYRRERLEEIMRSALRRQKALEGDRRSSPPREDEPADRGG